MRIDPRTKEVTLTQIEYYELLHKNTEPASEKLEQAATNYKMRTPFQYPNQLQPAYEGFIAGAQWQREQMMKDAIEGPFIRRNRYTKKNVLNNFDLTHDALQNFKDGQKLKVIFVPSDNK